MWKCPTHSLDYTFSYVESLQLNEILSFWKKIQFMPVNCAQKSFSPFKFEVGHFNPVNLPKNHL